jgi:O-acetyl-ADP-ribose deacetylase (regulator of RNase III)
VALGDITYEKVDAIVNPANSSLSHGGGCAAAISRAAGGKLDEESNNYVRAFGEIKVGECAFTSSGNLSANGIRYVIHTVGPIFKDREAVLPQQLLLYNAVFNALQMADKLQCRSIAIPAISSGIFGFPVPLCAQIIFSAINSFIKI